MTTPNNRKSSGDGKKIDNHAYMKTLREGKEWLCIHGVSRGEGCTECFPAPSPTPSVEEGSLDERYDRQAHDDGRAKNCDCECHATFTYKSHGNCCFILKPVAPSSPKDNKPQSECCGECNTSKQYGSCLNKSCACHSTPTINGWEEELQTIAKDVFVVKSVPKKMQVAFAVYIFRLIPFITTLLTTEREKAVRESRSQSAYDSAKEEGRTETKAAIFKLIGVMGIYDQEDSPLSHSAQHGYNAALTDLASKIRTL